ncbi:MAG: DEAD/DEAH box helicase [Verrucomicrobia bacterium]|nr:DEAD/DEAH box helicase [Verrucomicrobiota bacterium]MCH8513670.1 DEAD/DEAH box helicase [Kiritimatiellia bacterium]
MNSPSFGISPSGLVRCFDPQHPAWAAFEESEEAGLFYLGGHAAPSTADASCLYWKSIMDALVRRLCQLPGDENEDALQNVMPDEAALAEWALNAPPMPGAEYLSPLAIHGIWSGVLIWVVRQVRAEKGLAAFLAKRAPAWSRVGRVTLHLAENKNDPECPFAFMASYASNVSQSGRLTQLPLGKALAEYSGAKNKPALLNLLRPLHAAASSCEFMADLVESGDVFHPLAWTPEEAFRFLKQFPVYEEAGLLVRLPNWWRKRGTRPRVQATIGDQKKTGMGLDAMLDFTLTVEVDGVEVSPEELRELLAGDAEGLTLFRGQWIEVDRQKLQDALDHWQSLAKDEGISFIEGMRLLAGASEQLRESGEEAAEHEWAFAKAGGQLEDLLRQLAAPDPMPPPAALRATLRPYQSQGLDWLWFCARAGLGACLADDMGLGKTMQVLAALLRKQEVMPDAPPSLLVVPASLIGNWKREAARFAPGLRLHIAHASGEGAEEPERLEALDLVITTYGMLSRLDWPAEIQWGWVIVDEAQAIKNHGSRQSKAVRKLRAQMRVALTGTPVENRLGDLWALFDFINPGLLGTAAQFGDFVKQLNRDGQAHYAPLRRLVAPYILRRMKTDKSIITDLPEKTEMKVFCGLSPAQARFYQQSAEELARALADSDGMKRRGLVLSYLMRFKQICNHPDQLTSSGGYAPKDSAKFMRLIDLCEEIASRGEKALVFTQFKEITDPLENCLAGVFGQRGLILHGGTPVKARQDMVQRFQREEGPPFFVLSLKAGGTGLNLTAASHVIHFDRWWNPAVENQATDRAFRIGQRRNVLVHKMITTGTLEEKIDVLLTEKQDTADAILGEGAEKNLTEMNNEELLDFIRLDLSKTEAST